MTVTLSPTHRIAIATQPDFPDPHAQHLLNTIREYFGYDVQEIQIVKVYTITKDLIPEQVTAIASGPLTDPILQTCSTEEWLDPLYDWTVEVGFKPGLTDNAGKTAQLTIEDFLGVTFSDKETVHSSTKYIFKGNLAQSEVQKIAEELLANTLIQDVTLSKHKDCDVEEINLAVSDEVLEAISKGRQLALNLSEMQAIRSYYARPEVAKERLHYGLSANPTDVELEAIAQTWSEHCKHKIFNAKIKYSENGKTEEIDSLFKTCIKRATDELSEKCDWLVSVFTDNAGIIRFNDTHNLAFKVETHNSPSALDPYGGALTGILGVNRDIMGAGIGARLLANTDIFCFAPPDYDKPIPERLLHPKRVFEGVRLGVEHGGNKSGVPTVNGSIVFDDRYLGKPLVYCGTVGIMPATINGQPTHIKEIHKGDLIVIAGGRTGKDGIHGATFSSEELHDASPSSAVQIGDPFTQKKLHDFLLEARDAGLYRTLTDDGAGGFSSSIGELAQLSGGCEIHLDQALLKYDGLRPWEILLSESQERMTLAVDPSHFEALQHLAAIHEVEIVSVGTFTDSDKFHALYEKKTVALLSMEFFHDGLPQMKLEAEWTPPPENPQQLPENADCLEWHHLLERHNICSKESIVRQYDHEVQGCSALKPMVGCQEDGPGDAAIIRPWDFAVGNSKPQMWSAVSNSRKGIVISHGICPRYSDHDTYHMAANALDEAIRNAVAVGCNPSRIAILDNFCWPDPIYHAKKTPDGKLKLAQLVRANKALYDYATAFETPIISGKDSMKNDYKIGNTKISVPPTLLISAIGIIPDVLHAVSMDVKFPGDWVYIIGVTKNEWGGSEYAAMKGLQGGQVPHVDAKTANITYRALHEAIMEGLVASCHDCSDGGLAVSLAETSFAGGYGMNIDLHCVPNEGCNTDSEILFSESASRFVVTVSPDHANSFEEFLCDCMIGRIGRVHEDTFLDVTGLHDDHMKEDIRALKASWQKTFGGHP